MVEYECYCDRCMGFGPSEPEPRPWNCPWCGRFVSAKLIECPREICRAKTEADLLEEKFKDQEK